MLYPHLWPLSVLSSAFAINARGFYPRTAAPGLVNYYVLNEYWGGKKRIPR